MSAAPAMITPSPGELASNGMTIMCLTRAVQSGDSAFTLAPPLIAEALGRKAWMHWTDAGGSHFYDEDQFQDFVEAKPPRGLGVTPEVLEALLKPDSEAWVLFHEAMRRKPGGNNNPRGVNHNNIMVDHPATIPISRNRVSQEGTSTSYAIRRLGKERPDLLDQVKEGTISPHRAMVTAGFIEKAITIPDDPAKAARRLRKHFRGERLEALIRELSRDSE